MNKLRIDKVINDIKALGRKEVKNLIKQGKILVNDIVIYDPAFKVNVDDDVITLNGEILKYNQFKYFVMNKPSGVLSATEDSKQKTILDLMSIEDRKDIFPIGRLDKDTTGLILLTNDGNFAHNVISPKKKIKKIYEAEVDSKLDEKYIELFRKGIILGDGTKCMPADLIIISDYKCKIEVYEGKYHQVKRMMAACGTHVIKLNRIQIGELILDNSLKKGEYRQLSDIELYKVMNT